VKFTVGEIVTATRGRRVGGSDELIVDGLTNDSRSMRAGECFVAIVDRRDGHEFVASAFAAGAAAAIVERVVDVDRAFPIVVVDDVLRAIAELARVVRVDRLTSTRVVGVTGSTGKTSTKDFLASVLGRQWITHVNSASFNNEIGLPMTVLAAPTDAQFVVCEMGARFAGNIRELCAIAMPDTGIVTNIGSAHAEHLGGRDGVLATKSELLVALPSDGLAVLPAEDPCVDRLAAATSARVIRAGESESAEVTLRVESIDVELRAVVRLTSPWGSASGRLGLRGRHQVANASLAAAVALESGIGPDEVMHGLEAAVGSAWRMELARTFDGIMLLNDSYNANPQSMAAAIRALGELDVPESSRRGSEARLRRIAVLGTMRELGSTSIEEHEAIPPLLAAASVDELVVVGDDDAAIALAAAAQRISLPVRRVHDAIGAIDALRALRVGEGDAVLVKASRAVGLDAVARGLSESGGRS
jgi:UDP-N-acetylmuramoyl-tripeptide--D-alanyl-D-alanine ligase